MNYNKSITTIKENANTKLHLCKDCKYYKKYYTCFQMEEAHLEEAHYLCTFFKKPIKIWYENCRWFEERKDKDK